MKNKILALGLIAVTAGVFAYTRPHNAIPADLRDAPRETALDQLGMANLPNLDPVPVPSEVVNLPAAGLNQSDAAQISAREFVILVHGYKPEKGELDPLERELGSRGYTVVRFEYDFAQSLEVSANELVSFVLKLRSDNSFKKLTIIAHSMGGLVSRRAMIQGRDLSLAGLDMSIKLVTIASPFGGYQIANATMSFPLNIFGITESARYLGTKRQFIRNPGLLGTNITHIKIQTDERGKTREADGALIGDDAALPENQINSAIDNDPALKRNFTLDAGHVAVIYDNGQLSAELRGTLDEIVPVIIRTRT